MIMGIVVDEKQRAIGHKLANDILKYVSEELENVLDWSENADVVL